MEKKITFEPAITIPGAGTLREVTMQEPRLKDMRAVDRMEGSDLDKEATMISRLTGINIEDLNELTAAQYKRLQGEYADFFDFPGQKQGGSA